MTQTEEKKLSLELFRELYGSGAHRELQDLLHEEHPAEVADIIDLLNTEERVAAFEMLKPEVASEVLFELNNSARELILDHIEEERIAEIIDEMDSDDAADVVGELDSRTRSEVLRELTRLDSEDAKEIHTLLRYTPASAGGNMQLELVSVTSNQTVIEAEEACRRKAGELDRIYDVYVVDVFGKLIGAIPVDKLLLASPDTTCDKLMVPDPISIPATMDQEEVAEIFKRHDLPSLPVVNEDGTLLGRITSDDIIDIIEEERAEDMLLMVGAGEDERVLDSPLRAVRRRLPWLLAYLATGMVTASVIKLFDDTIAAVVIVASFMPVVAGMGGNTGIQTLAVVVRGIALGEADREQVLPILFKEIGVAILNGMLVGATAALLTYFWLGSMLFSGILWCSMILAVMIASIMGASIPLLLKAIKIDPALASGVLLTTITDITGMVIFLGLCTLLKSQLMGY